MCYARTVKKTIFFFAHRDIVPVKKEIFFATYKMNKLLLLFC